MLILSAHSDDAYVEQVGRALGPRDFLLKQTSSDSLADAIREVEKGKTFFSPAISKRFKVRREKAAWNGRETARKATS